MRKAVKSLNGKWTFDHFTKKDEVKITNPSILLTVEPYPIGHNSNFPFKVTYGYYLDNPNSALNDNPPFELFGNEEIFILINNYTDNVEDSLIKDLKELKKYYNIKIYTLKTEL